nr:uncharacterized protein K02A2.6-like [Rhipicephalus microplus]
MLNRLLGEFEDVFSTDLGLIKGPPASLKLKETATPKFCRQFTLVTDHQPLLGLLKPDRQTPPMAAARIQRWALFLGGYHYKLQYVPGKQLLTADALSRLPAPAAAEPVAEGEPPEYVLSLEALDEGIVTTHELQELTAKDSLLARAAEYILHGWPPTTSGMMPDLLPFFDRKMELSMAHRLTYRGNRVIIPRKAQEKMLQLLHETHQGSSSIKAVARSLFWWPGMDREIQEFSAQRVSCVENLPMPAAAPPVSWPKRAEKWSRIHINFAGSLAGKMILVVVDAHTKWIEAIAMMHANTAGTIRCLRSLFCRFGVPRTIVSDNGTQFTSQEFATFVARNNIVHLRTAPFHPQSNGAAERAVRTLKDGLRKMQDGPLEDKIMRLLFHYRRTPQKEGKSPSEVLLGYQLRFRLDTCLPPREEKWSPGADDWIISPGSSVYVRNYGAGKRWTPGRVKAASGARMIAVDTPRGLVQRHVDQVRRRRESTPESATAGMAEGADAEAEPASMTTPVPSPALRRAFRRNHQERIPELPAADGRSEFSPPAVTEPPVATDEHLPEVVPHQPTLRRSTRVRNPVQRFQF